MSKSIKTNYIFNLINTVSSLIFPVLTFPYASRIMLAEGIGQVNFYQSIIQYISLFTCLGIPMYAIREIAKVRDNQYECNKTTLEILLLHFSLTFLGYLLVFILCLLIPEIQVNIPLFLILSTSILFTTIGCEWFYQGIEDFKYITIRGLIVKISALFILFICVKTPQDILWYGMYCVVGVVGGNIFNFIRLKKYISFIPFKQLHPLKLLKPALRIFVLNLIISLYVNLNSVMLGFIKDTESVGLFTAATRLSQMILGVTSALGTVMLPRLTNLLSNQQKEEFNRLAQKATEFIFAISLPITVGTIVLAPELIILFCGSTYHAAITTLQLISPIIVLISLSGILGIQILYPQGKENIVIICTAIGAASNFILNLCLVPSLSQDGAAIATLVAEFLVTFSMMLIGRRYIPINWKSKSFLNYCIGTAIMAFAIVPITLTSNTNSIISLIACIAIGIIIYAIYLGLTKDKLYYTFKDFLTKKRS